MNRSWKWYIKFPTDAYAMGPIEFDKNIYDKAPNEKDVRAYAREWEGSRRLPTRFECWTTK